MELLLQQRIFFIQRCVGDGHIVGVDGHGDAAVEEHPDGMFGEGWNGFGLNIARRTHFENDLFLF